MVEFTEYGHVRERFTAIQKYPNIHHANLLTCLDTFHCGLAKVGGHSDGAAKVTVPVQVMFTRGGQRSPAP